MRISYILYIFICHKIHVNCSKNEFTVNWTFYQLIIWNVFLVRISTRKFRSKIEPKFLRRMTKDIQTRGKIGEFDFHCQIAYNFIAHLWSVWKFCPMRPTYPNAHEKVRYWIFDVQFSGNRSEISIILNDFWSSTIWPIQI